ncbi:MAG: GAF domain-containing protein [Chlorobi bacterium]|nr:GAF domain-containing protein [Chlorobiota bacterium]
MTKQQKADRYKRMYVQIEKLVRPHDNPLSTMATIAAVLHHKMKDFYWTGFYLIQEDGELLVGPYQGMLACIKLKKNTGVCWAAINRRETVIVPDVHKFPGHIACDSASNSEIVVPVKDKSDNIIGVMDVDSTGFDSFDKTDKEGLERIVRLVTFV